MDQVRLICFNQEVIKALKERMPNYKAYWLTGFKNKHGSWEPSLEEVLGTLQACKADGLDSHHTIPPEFSKAVLGAGFEWHAWTINDVETAKRLAKRDIYSITTDRPKLIGSGLDK
jgi:glycerophosphoryl diester phosphodiesterase